MTSVAPRSEHVLTAAERAALPRVAQKALQDVDDLKYFLISAPVSWEDEKFIKRFPLPTGEYVACVLWNGLYHISGTDIVRCLAFRFGAFGRPVKNVKKFEEGIFSDLRNLKAGTDASLEDPKSPFLDFLFKNNCIRTQKKQKVFYWYSVPHDRLFLDALERDLKREKAGQESTSAAEAEPALSFEYDASQSLYEQISKMTTESTPPAGDATGTRDSMPPPHTVHRASSQFPDALSDQSLYSQTANPLANHMMRTMTPYMMSTTMAARSEPQYGPVAIPSFVAPPPPPPRQNSVPAFVEYSSPALSYVSSAQSHSFHDDSTTRGLSYEPMTPPQHAIQYGNINNYSPQTMYTPQSTGSNYSMNGMTPQYGAIRASSDNMQQDGSPALKIRRTSSAKAYPTHLTAGPHIAHGPLHAPRRPSELRRSVSAASIPPVDMSQRSASGPPSTFMPPTEYMTPAGSRGVTPVSTIDGQPMSYMKQRYATMMSDNYSHNYGAIQNSPQYGIATSPVPSLAGSPSGAIRTSRSASLHSETGPYTIKNHTCPIPACEKSFKRLEHLKRHVKSHTEEKPYSCNICPKAFSRSDNLAAHRRTHETDSNGNPLGMEITEDDDEDTECADISTQDFALASGAHLQISNHNGQMTDSFNAMLSGAKTMSGAQEIMGPPLIPASAMNGNWA